MFSKSNKDVLQVLVAEGDARFLEDESTKVFDRKVADHYSARMNQTLEEQGASPIIHLKKLNKCIESVLIQLYAHRRDAVLDLACGKGRKMGQCEPRKLNFGCTNGMEDNMYDRVPEAQSYYFPCMDGTQESASQMVDKVGSLSLSESGMANIDGSTFGDFNIDVDPNAHFFF
ncbi:mRNA cap guanine-N7 methyltransferase 1 [Camellia lanceoleosa]|uniref:mRNA cap guanine-N7 methyltransferase 1 n=1 Tax=Camellia lanceoleosa TaxID=1840588 RepID=A0ACC0G4Y8_9ERIC|nr:mRNA cap guanine-N7 methyltransferase 1 [Camellia lanceoleosa]